MAKKQNNRMGECAKTRKIKKKRVIKSFMNTPHSNNLLPHSKKDKCYYRHGEGLHALQGAVCFTVVLSMDHRGISAPMLAAPPPRLCAPVMHEVCGDAEIPQCCDHPLITPKTQAHILKHLKPCPYRARDKKQ